MENKKVRVVYSLAQEGQKDSLRKGGDGKREQAAFFDLTPEWLELARVADDGKAFVDLRSPVEYYRWEVVTLEYRDTGSPPELTPSTWDQTRSVEAPPVGGPFDHVPDEAELMAVTRAMRAAKEAKAAREREDMAITARHRDYQAAKEQFREINAAYFAEQEAHREEARLRQEEETAKEEADRLEWIEAHGSERLRLAAANGYRYKRIYVDERLALDFPGYVADHGACVTEDSRYNPSLEALRELERLRPILAGIPGINDEKLEIVWLPKGLSELDDDDDEWDDEESGEACEAVQFILDGVYCYRVAL